MMLRLMEEKDEERMGDAKKLDRQRLKREKEGTTLGK